MSILQNIYKSMTLFDPFNPVKNKLHTSIPQKHKLRFK